MQRMTLERENELVTRAQGGDKDACGSLLWQYRWLVSKVVRGVLDGSATDVEVEDVVQETFLYAFSHIQDYQPGRFYRWLWTLAKNRAANQRVKLWRKMQMEFPINHHILPRGSRDGWDWTPSTLSGMSKRLEYGANAERHYDDDDARIFKNDIEPFPKLEDLTRQESKDWEMYAGGMKPRDIAKKTGRSANTVRVNVHKAKKKVRRELMISNH